MKFTEERVNAGRESLAPRLNRIGMLGWGLNHEAEKKKHLVLIELRSRPAVLWVVNHATLTPIHSDQKVSVDKA